MRRHSSWIMIEKIVDLDSGRRDLMLIRKKLDYLR